MAPAILPTASRYASRITVEPVSGCWLWTGSIADTGYGRLHRHAYAHRTLYEELVGPIPSELELDHLCRQRRCVNVAHLEPVTHQENSKRSPRCQLMHCPRGHALTPENMSPNRGARRCLTCHREREHLRYHMKMAYRRAGLVYE